MNMRIRTEIETMESMIFSSSPKGIEGLPQLADDSETIIDVMQDATALPHDILEAELHHQIDPSYE